MPNQTENGRKLLLVAFVRKFARLGRVHHELDHNLAGHIAAERERGALDELVAHFLGNVRKAHKTAAATALPPRENEIN
jgi:hypothetical protein